MGAWFAFAAAGLLTLWACAALYFDLPVPSLRAGAAIAYLLAVSTVLVVFRADWRGTLISVCAGRVYLAGGNRQLSGLAGRVCCGRRAWSD